MTIHGTAMRSGLTHKIRDPRTWQVKHACDLGNLLPVPLAHGITVQLLDEAQRLQAALELALKRGECGHGAELLHAQQPLLQLLCLDGQLAGIRLPPGHPQEVLQGVLVLCVHRIDLLQLAHLDLGLYLVQAPDQWCGCQA